ncbi:MAG: polyprenyl synthetase family protein [Chloroflexota bacterium]
MAMTASRINQPLMADLARVEEQLALVGQEAGPLLHEAIRHHLSAGGKRMRPRIALLTGRLLGHEATDDLVRFAAVTELVHAASLVHDDTIDDAATRRGEPTVGATWGGHIAVLVGDYLFAQAAIITAGLGSLRLMSLLAATIQALVRGELRQMSAAYNIEASAANYEARISDKSASLFVLATEGAGILAGVGEEQVEALHQFSEHLGLAFQIADDVLDYTGSDQELGKPAGSDLANGVITLPALRYLQSPRTDALDRRIVEEGGEIARVVAAIRASDGLEYALGRARTLCHEAVSALRTFPLSPAREALEALAEETVRRRS